VPVPQVQGGLTSAQLAAGAVAPAAVSSTGSILGADGSPVSGATTDLRALAAWFKGGITGKRVCWWGDSTTDQMNSGGIVLNNGTWLYPLSPALAQAGVVMKNKGANGSSLASLMGGSPGNAADGTSAGIAAVAALGYDLYVICLGINDCRTDTTIIGSYGSAGQIAKAQALQALFVSAAAQIRAVNPSAAIIWRMPNAHITGTSYITGGVSAQNCMDVYRLTYAGDSALGVASLDSLVSGSLVYNTLNRFFNHSAYTSYASVANGRLDPDGLHPNTQFYQDLVYDIGGLLTDAPASSISTSDQAARLAATQVGWANVTVRPASPETDANYAAIASATVNNSQATYFDAYFNFANPSLNADAGNGLLYWGAASGAGYGTAQVPALAVDDVIVWYPAGASKIVMPIRRMGDSYSGYVRWYSGGPDGYYPTLAQLPVGTLGVVYRRKFAGSIDFAAWQSRSSGYAGGLVLPKAYPFGVVSASTGSLSVRGIAPWGGYSNLTGKTVTATDRLILPGVTPAGGLLLTGMTWTPHASDPGRGTIAVSGIDFAKYSIGQGFILSAT
jgi:hypothetical protein